LVSLIDVCIVVIIIYLLLKLGSQALSPLISLLSLILGGILGTGGILGMDKKLYSIFLSKLFNKFYTDIYKEYKVLLDII